MRILAGTKRPSLSLILFPADNWDESEQSPATPSQGPAPNSSNKLDPSSNNNNSQGSESHDASSSKPKGKTMTTPKIYHEKQVCAQD